MSDAVYCVSLPASLLRTTHAFREGLEGKDDFSRPFLSGGGVTGINLNFLPPASLLQITTKKRLSRTVRGKELLEKKYSLNESGPQMVEFARYERTEKEADGSPPSSARLERTLKKPDPSPGSGLLFLFYLHHGQKIEWLPTVFRHGKADS